jgi:acyl dehydratase
MSNHPQSWTIAAQNLPEHARNPIHTDAGAQAAGFPRALVAGVTTYAYLTHPVAAAWGRNWIARGGGEVRFRRPVFDGDHLTCAPVAQQIEADVTTAEIHALTGTTDQPRAIFTARTHAESAVDLRPGETLTDLDIELTGEWGADYGERAGDLLSLYRDHQIVHPAVWPAIANQVVHTQVAQGSWIHTRSIVRHHDLAPVGARALVRSRVVRRFEAHGERAILDVEIRIATSGTDLVVATLEHEAIVALP